MNKEILKGNWNEYKGKVKQTWGKLTDSELTQVNGKVDELCGLIQKKYGMTKEQAEKDIQKFVTTSCKDTKSCDDKSSSRDRH